MKPLSRTAKTAILLLLAAAAYAVDRFAGWDVLGGSGPGRGPAVQQSADAIAEAFAARRSGVMVESQGVVETVLPDDNEGSRHQRFITRLPSGQTVLVAHNIDLAPRVPLGEGDRVRIRGQYEWNERGGVVHWTHRDPDGRHPGGWIRHRERVYE